MTKSVTDGEMIPFVGMGCTLAWYSDRDAATVIEVKSKSTIIVQTDVATRTDNNGMSECQTYTYSPNPQGEKFIVRKTVKGWKVLKKKAKVYLGTREKYRDFSF
jgi:hypothetical protein